jgi:hypothetical protein
MALGSALAGVVTIVACSGCLPSEEQSFAAAEDVFEQAETPDAASIASQLNEIFGPSLVHPEFTSAQIDDYARAWCAREPLVQFRFETLIRGVDTRAWPTLGQLLVHLRDNCNHPDDDELLRDTADSLRDLMRQGERDSNLDQLTEPTVPQSQLAWMTFASGTACSGTATLARWLLKKRLPGNANAVMLFLAGSGAAWQCRELLDEAIQGELSSGW